MKKVSSNIVAAERTSKKASIWLALNMAESRKKAALAAKQAATPWRWQIWRL